MVFDSLLDAWGVALGLKVISIMWDLLIQSGLITLAILAIFVTNTKALIQQGYSDELFNSTFINLLLVIAVWTFAVYPWATFQISDIKTYPKLCEDPRARVSKAIISDYSSKAERANNVLANQLDVIMEGEKVRTPIIINATLALSQAFKNAAVSQLPCSTDINLIESEISATKLNGYIREEVAEFIQWCYWPARAKARRNGIYPGKGILPEEKYMWPGHPFFLDTYGYYDNAEGNGYYSKEAFYGFADTKNILLESEDLPSGYGYPTCKEWWLGVNNNTSFGLRHKLYRATPNWAQEESEGFYAYISSWFDSEAHEKSFLDRRDAVVKEVFFSNRDISEYAASIDYGLDKGDTNLVDYAARIVGTVGVGMSVAHNTIGNSMIQLMAPMAKPLIILVILTAYVPAMLFGGFKIKHVTTFVAVIASIMFWPFLWELGRIVDDTILDATGGKIFGSMGINQAMLSQYLAGFFFLYGPMLFTAAMGWVGMAGGEMASAKQRVSSSAGSSGQKGAQKTQQAANQKYKAFKKAQGKG